MAGKDVLYYGETESRPFLRSTGFQADAVEALGKPRYVLIRYSRSEVLNAGFDGLTSALQFHDDLLPGLTIFAGVLDQVLEYLSQFVAVTQYAYWTRLDVPLYFHAEISGKWLEGIGDMIEHCG